MSIKEFIKNTMIGKKLSNVKRILTANCSFNYDRYLFKRYSATNKTKNYNNYLELRILVISHMIEKGVSHINYRAGFGKENIRLLSNLLIQYNKLKNKDDYIIKTGYAALNCYHEKNKLAGYDDSDYVMIPNLQTKDTAYNGAKDVKLNLDYNNMTFVEICKNRHSIRLYENVADDISVNEIKESIELAQYAPNACNRQATRVHIVQDKQYFNKIIQLQKGCKGFGENVSAFAIITSDLSMYECSERRLPLYDAGLFSMNFTYSLLCKNIYSCILNGSFMKKEETEIKQMLQIKNNEIICGLMALYKLDDVKDTIRIPVSERRVTSEILTIH